MALFLRYTLESVDSDASNSLVGLQNQANEDRAYIQENNRYYRYFSASTATPDGSRVLAPAGIVPPDPGRWIVQGPPGPSKPIRGNPAALAGFAPNAFQHYITSRKDLSDISAPAGGVYTLPGGSYMFTDPVELDTSETVLWAADAVVEGARPGCGLLGDAATPLMTTTAGASMTFNRFTSYNVSGMSLLNNSDTFASHCDLQTDAAVFTLHCLLGNWTGQYNNILCSGLSRAVRHEIGDYNDYGSRHAAGTTCIDNVGTAGILNLDHSTVIGGLPGSPDGQNGIRLRSPGIFTECDIQVETDNGGAISVLGASSIRILGGRLRASAAGAGRTGLWFLNGVAATEIAQLDDVRFENVNWGVRNNNALAQGTLQFGGLVMGADVDTGIDSLVTPTNGLSIFNSTILCATPFVGFTEATGRVNIKGVIGPAGLLAETPIV